MGSQSRLNRRALGLALVGVALIVAMVWLGLWQLGVYDDQQHRDAEGALAREPVPLSQVMGPDDAFPGDGVGRPVTVQGTFLARDQLYVRSMPGAADRYAVVTPLVTAGGSAVLVVRGSSDQLGAPSPIGLVDVRGVLEPSDGNGSAPDAQRVTSGLSIASLVGVVGPDLYSGYILQQSSTPPQAPALERVSAPLPDPSRWSGARNLAYACQWWVFAGFVAFMWWRMTGELQPRDRPSETLG